MADNASITILRNTQANIDAEPIKDGNILFTTDQSINNAIYTDVGTKRIKIGGTVPIDSTITADSVNPVTSKAIYTEVDDVRGQICTNLLNPTAQTQTVNGVTFTNNGDGTYTANGMASGPAVFSLMTFNDVAFFENKKLIGCPAGGSSADGSSLAYMLYISCGRGSTWLKEYHDYGNGVIISNFPSEATIVVLNIFVQAGQTVNNLTFKPMLTTDLSATYDSFVKYSGSEERLNEQVASLHESSKGVITNLLNPAAKTQTINGVTFTTNGNGTYTVNGTASDYTVIFLGTIDDTNLSVSVFQNSKLVGCPKGGSAETYFIGIDLYHGETWVTAYQDIGNGVISNIPSNIDRLTVYILIKKGVTCNNLLFKPMFTKDLSATYDDYVPYTGDSGRLNEDVANIFNVFHPIGSLYSTTNTTFNPNSAKGWHGTWERIKDCVIYASGDSDTVGAIVGSNTHTLTEAELPSHTHSIPALSGSTGGSQLSYNFVHLTKENFGYGFLQGGAPLGDASGYPATASTSTRHTHTVTTTASTTGASGSGNAIDIRPRRLNSIVWRRIS